MPHLPPPTEGNDDLFSDSTTSASQNNSFQIEFFGTACLGFILMHLLCLLVFWQGISVAAVATFFLTFLTRTFALTGGFHRYFSHRSFRTGRLFQFILGFVGTAAMQRGPLWWAAHHRHHHAYSDTEHDIHSPVTRGFWWSHMGWIMSNRYGETNTKLIKDLTVFPELRWLDRFFLVPPVMLILSLYVVGEYFSAFHPNLQTSGFQLVLYGFVISTVALYHTTFCVNSLTHVYGNRRFATRDDSRNNALVAFLTMGEGWHNNHHFYPASARQGFFWWEIDATWWILKMLSWVGGVSEIQAPPNHIYARANAEARTR